MPGVDSVEADERREQTDVGFGQGLAEQKPALGKLLLEPIERIEQRDDRFLIRRLRRREAAPRHRRGADPPPRS